MYNVLKPINNHPQTHHFLLGATMCYKSSPNGRFMALGSHVKISHVISWNLELHWSQNFDVTMTYSLTPLYNWDPALDTNVQDTWVVRAIFLEVLCSLLT